MRNESYDLAIVGSGFAGSLLAMIARRQGRSVVLIERGTHPRMAIGESSTPLSNLLLEELADRYGLESVRPLSKWGSWQREHPELACGLKRGFTFYHHPPEGEGCAGRGAGELSEIPRERQLLVAASPHDGIADTHWYRADFDQFLVRQAEQAGVDYLDRVQLEECTEAEDYVELRGIRCRPEGAGNGGSLRIRARLVVDASGPHSFLHRAVGLGELPVPGMPLTQGIYSHFSGVKRSGLATTEEVPYPPEAAAVHHIFAGGWIWLLHFNSGITSAGAALTDEAVQRLGLDFRQAREDGQKPLQAGWQRLVDSIPALSEAFCEARSEQPFTWIPRLSFRRARIAGRRWVLLPSAAGFCDPLLSTGFPLTLLGIRRLAEILEHTSPGEEAGCEAGVGLAAYAAQTEAELLAAGDLIGALYGNFDNFSVFTALTMLYFAAVSYAETAYRLGRPELAPGFLLYDHPTFGPELRRLTAEARGTRASGRSAKFSEEVARAIEPINVAGLADPRRRNWYPVETQDLFDNAHKLCATREDIEELLRRCGFGTASAVRNERMQK